MSFRASESPLVHGFQSFYYNLLRQKEKALGFRFAQIDIKDIDTEKTEKKDSEIYDEANKYNIAVEEEVKKDPMVVEIEAAIFTIQQNLIKSIEEIVNVASLKTRINPQYLQRAKYAMIVLADEVFINLTWDGAKYWRYSLLEKRLFKTEIGGEKIFSMIDDLVSNYHPDLDDLLFIYLMVISLGFEGKFRGLDHATEHISWYREKLYSFLNNYNSKLFYPGRSYLIPKCYESTIISDNRAELPDVRFWTVCIIVVITIYIIVSYAVWYNLTDDINDVLENIFKIVRQGTLV